MKPKLLSPMLYGKYCEVEMNGKIYRRVTRYSKADGLYIVVATRKYFEYNMEIAYDKNRSKRGEIYADKHGC